jgi:hypothetical protein
MKPDPLTLYSADAFQKWSDEHRAQMWNMIERLGKGEVTCKEARDVLREEKKALSAARKQMLGFKTGSQFASSGIHSPRNRYEAGRSGTAAR